MNRFSKILIFLILIASTLFAQTARDCYYLSLSYFEMQKYDSSLIFIDKAIEKNNSNYILYLEKGKICRSAKDFDNAIIAFNYSNTLVSSSADFDLSKIYALLNDNEHCFQYLESHLKSEFKNDKSEILLENDFKKFHENITWKKIWKNDWYSPKEELIAEINYLMKSNNFNDAMVLANNYLLTHSKDYKVLSLRAKIYANTSEYAKAIKDLNAALKIKKIPEIFEQRADCYSETMNFDKAIIDYSLALKTDFPSLELYLKLAKAKNNAGDFNGALTDLKYYKQYTAEKEIANYYLGVINFNATEYYEALPYFNELIKEFPANELYYTTRGNIYAETHNYDLSNKDFSMILDLNPKSSDSYYKMGLNLLKLNRYDSACYSFRKAKSLGNVDADYYLEKHCRE